MSAWVGRSQNPCSHREVEFRHPTTVVPRLVALMTTHTTTMTAFHVEEEVHRLNMIGRSGNAGVRRREVGVVALDSKMVRKHVDKI